MKIKKCPRCQTENLESYTFCQNCDYPLKGKEKSFASTMAYIFLIWIIIFLILSVTAFAYLEIKHPDYGLKNRLKAVYHLMVDKNWKKYRKSSSKNASLSKSVEELKKEKESLDIEIDSKKAELDLANKTLQKLNKEIENAKKAKEESIKLLEGINK